MLLIFFVPGSTVSELFSLILPSWLQKEGYLINLPGQTNPKRVRELLQGTANLEFWETYENSEIIGYLITGQ